MKTLLPQVLQHINSAARRALPDNAVDVMSELDKARDAIADICAARCAIENRVRFIQAIASRGRGMSRVNLDQHLEDIVTRLRQL